MTGASLKALEKKSIKDYSELKSQSTASDVYLEGVIVDSGDWLSGFDGFITPAQIRKRLGETSGEVTLHIDSPGGSVFAASNILTQIIKLRSEGRVVNVLIGGLCASAATYFLFEADKSMIAPMGMVMVHRSWTMAAGNSEDLEKVAGLLRKADEQYVAQVVSLTGKEPSVVEGAVNEETWFTGEEAIEWGLVDELYTNAEPVEDDDVSNEVDWRLLVSQISDFKY